MWKRWVEWYEWKLCVEIYRLKSVLVFPYVRLARFSIFHSTELNDTFNAAILNRPAVRQHAVGVEKEASTFSIAKKWLRDFIGRRKAASDASEFPPNFIYYVFQTIFYPLYRRPTLVHSLRRNAQFSLQHKSFCFSFKPIPYGLLCFGWAGPFAHI